ncbi:hypothetical protein FOL47_007275 [Perkinsus chesapeaki]|uniref:Carboxylic ester hydrolase n=1 Tax=Perkinsus chesapeaki TaxID=330153 RepID=A0A7J6LLQ9_PERCH|nr:hypothetical protein FOL47_007275 [Perkinsus chesapeaki]
MFLVFGTFQICLTTSAGCTTNPAARLAGSTTTAATAAMTMPASTAMASTVRGPPPSSKEGEEDCLFLNVYRPVIAANGTARLPVMFWVYGGGYTEGDALLYNGTAIAAAHDVIVVTVNYRLGHLGFFGSQKSFEEEGTTGNWGTLDTQLGLKWVRENIEAFGGDKDRVLLFGESAGAFSVMWHIAAPGSKGLFHAAIIESGTSSTGIFFQNQSDAFKYYDWVAKDLAGCQSAHDLDCLRQTESNKFDIPAGIRFDPSRAPTWGSPLFPHMPVGPIVDGTALPDVPLHVIKKGMHNDVPLILGLNRNEGSMFGFMLADLVPGLTLPPRAKDSLDASEYFLQNSTAAQELTASLYPPDEYSTVYGEDNTYFEQIFYVIRDAMFHCSMRRLATALAESGRRSHTWMYSFDKPDIYGTWSGFRLGKFLPAFGNLTLAELGTVHGSEVPFVFKQFMEGPANLTSFGKATFFSLFTAHPPRQPGDAFHKVSDAFSCMWASMAASGAPTDLNTSCLLINGSLPSWLPYNSSFNGSSEPEGVYMHIGDVLEMRSWRDGNIYPDNEMPSLHQCKWWDEHPIVFHDLRTDLKSATTAPLPSTSTSLPSFARSDFYWNSCQLLLFAATLFMFR